jgi:lipopolysaccharide export system protein LptA
MKFRTNKLSLKIALAGALLAASLPALAKTGDTDQPRHFCCEGFHAFSGRWN